MWNRSRGWLPKFKAHTGISEEKLGDCWASRETGDLDSYVHKCNGRKHVSVIERQKGFLKIPNF